MVEREILQYSIHSCHGNEDKYSYSYVVAEVAKGLLFDNDHNDVVDVCFSCMADEVNEGDEYLYSDYC